MKYTLIDEKRPYALILRGESMTQYAVVRQGNRKLGLDMLLFRLWKVLWTDESRGPFPCAGLLSDADGREAHPLCQNE